MLKIWSKWWVSHKYTTKRIEKIYCTVRGEGQVLNKQGRKRPLDTPKRMIERRERVRERERKVEGEI